MTPHSSNKRPPQKAGGRDYLRIMRLDHMTKHVFILPGIALAFLLREMSDDWRWWGLVTGFASAVCIASANYVINEWLDREFDALHPEKSQRAAVQKDMSGQVVLALYVGLLVLGIALSLTVNTVFFVTTVLFALAGMLYNIWPIRFKDWPYIDVLSESLNNPIRLVLGWSMIDAHSLPPLSLLLGYWLGGAFLMNSKRLAEYRSIVAQAGENILHRYRRSFAHYDEPSLLVANLVYALGCAFFLAIFLIKYRIEYLLIFPLLTALFAEYFRVALLADSVARKPERLFRARRLMVYSVATAVAFVVLTFVEIEWIRNFAEPNIVEFERDEG